MTPGAEAFLLHFVLAYVGGLIAVLSVPMATGGVDRNSFYGFRTPKTMSDDRIWNVANRAVGRAGIAAGLAFNAFEIVSAILRWPFGVAVAAPVVAVVGIFVYGLVIERRL